MESWIPEETGSDVLLKVKRISAIDNFATPIPMLTDTRYVLRDFGTDVDVTAKGAAYNEDATPNDRVQIDQYKFTRSYRIAEEDLKWGAADMMIQKRSQFANFFGRKLDNAALGVNAAANAGTVPFTSVYKAVTTADATTGVSYTANANHITAADTVTYQNLSDLFARLEVGDYYDDAETVVMANDFFRGTLRTMVDGGGNLIFSEGGQGQAPTLFGKPIIFTKGATVTTTALAQVPAPPTSGISAKGAAGNPLIIVGNRQHLLMGVPRDRVWAGPSWKVIGPEISLTDEAVLKCRAFRGFAVGNPNAFAVLERTRTS